MAVHLHHTGTKAGTIGGTLFSVIVNLQAGDVLHTVFLAGIGATVSFVVSHVLKWLLAWFKRR